MIYQVIALVTAALIAAYIGGYSHARVRYERKRDTKGRLISRRRS